MNAEERQKIIDSAVKLKASAVTSAEQPIPAAPALTPQIRTTGDVSIRIVDENNPPTEVRSSRRQGVVQHVAGPAQTGPRVMGARVVTQEDLTPGTRQRQAAQPGMYGGVIQAQPDPLAQTLRTPLPPSAHVGAGVSPNLQRSAHLDSQMQAMGQMPAQGVAPGAPVTAIMAQHVRPDTFEKQHRTLMAAGIAESNMRCWVAPAGVALNDGLIGRVPNVRAGNQIAPGPSGGPWMRWTLAFSVETKYTLVIDDDCNPGNEWLLLAVQRLEKAEAAGGRLVIAAAGSNLRSDQYDDENHIGLESLHREETVVDLGRGAWLFRTIDAPIVPNYPVIGSYLATPIHVAAATQAAGIATVVLPYTHNKRSVWGMLEAPMTQGSITAGIERDIQQGRGGTTPAGLRAGDYKAYRAAGWEPLCVMEAEASTSDDEEEEPHQDDT